ncbi:MAG: hypothetical protein KGH98_04555 [Candidatus Micrarchaeota archaeon]|nr:hypothetical protein [Candidatus Micrarchaeota archaeon]
MPDTLEFEKTYLVKYLPEGLEKCANKELIDIYFPASEKHCHTRIRKDGGKFVITKKEPLHGNDSSSFLEQTINLDRGEFDALSKIDGKRLRKVRYAYNHSGHPAEIDVFKDALEGLVLADFEFAGQAEMEAFRMPDFCLAEVTQEEFVAGGYLCGKSYGDIGGHLNRYGYHKLI